MTHRIKNVGEDWDKIRTHYSLVYLSSQLLLQSLESDFHMIETLNSVSKIIEVDLRFISVNVIHDRYDR